MDIKDREKHKTANLIRKCSLELNLKNDKSFHLSEGAFADLKGRREGKGGGE